MPKTNMSDDSMLTKVRSWDFEGYSRKCHCFPVRFTEIISGGGGNSATRMCREKKGRF